ncbi:hypothetical protein H9Q69_002204 [Fusarium xylarioides]|uniref:Uncharacterized protein n=1 Tax=Fusarium xylarioides TaxID=221167 RepID=A0A9P7L4W7_9HYPO|nr:hypothetical protein H9Q72_002581 [Fusarium xylarioides]KAG5798796.1 hypothetical protein H9Q69_002204 [Fusarium xylarioides]
MSKDDNVLPDLLDFPLVEDPELSGTTRAEIAQNIFQHAASDFSIIIREQYVVHGKWSEAGTNHSAASFLVFRVELHSRSPKQNRRFKHVLLRLRFERDPPGRPADDPIVKCFEPAQGVVITHLPTEVALSKERGVDANLGIETNPSLAKATIRYGGQNTTSWQRHETVRIAGSAKMTPDSRSEEEGKRLGDDLIEWSFHENPREKEIPDSYGLAVLLQRPDLGSNFRITFEVKATVDFWYQVRTLIERFNGWQKRTRLYDPSRQGSCPDGVDPQNLGDLSEGLKLSKFSFNHLPESVKPAQIYTSREEAQVQTAGSY